MVISWDIALSEAQTGDSSAGVVLLCRGDTFYVLEVCKGQFPFGKLIEKILDMVKRYHPNSSLVIEESPISIGLIQALKQNHINVVTITPTKDKRSRVISQTDRFEGGSVLLPERAEWLDGFIGELLSFPGGRHDDQVDALVQGMAWMRAQWMPPVENRTTLKISRRLIFGTSLLLRRFQRHCGGPRSILDETLVPHVAAGRTAGRTHQRL